MKKVEKSVKLKKKSHALRNEKKRKDKDANAAVKFDSVGGALCSTKIWTCRMQKDTFFFRRFLNNLTSLIPWK